MEKDMNMQLLGTTWLPSQLQAVNPLFILLFVPLFSYLIYPAIDRVFPLTPLRKIGLGMFLTVPAFAISGLIQVWIDGGATPSIGWQVLAYGLLTAAEVMVSITCLEFSYTQAPPSIKSIVMSLYLASIALGNEFTHDRTWQGSYHLVAIYSRALSPDDVTANFRAGIASTP